MKNTRIYLRSISVNEKNQLMLFDSNRNGAIDDLVTKANAGSTVRWKLDRCSGIKRILKIHSKSGKGNIFRTEPKRWWFFNIFYLALPKDAAGEERYNIEYQLYDNTKVTIEPTIIIKHP